jgi:hypothetical protein
MKIFKKDPKDRIKTMNEVLDHSFFHPEQDSSKELLQKIERSLDEVAKQQQKMTDLLKSIKTDTMQIKDVSTKTLAQVCLLPSCTAHSTI